MITFQRDIVNALAELNNYFPVICITGPRQSGKTTLARSFYPDKKYYNLEDPDVRNFIMQDPKGLLLSLGEGEGAIFDEIQHFPDLLSYLQTEADKNEIKDYTGAIEDYNAAISLDSNYARAYYNRGISYLRLRKHAEAVLDFKKALDLDPGMGEAKINLEIARKEPPTP